MAFVVGVFATALGNVHEAPLRFNALMMKNPIISYPLLKKLILTHYSQQAIQQVRRTRDARRASRTLFWPSSTS